VACVNYNPQNRKSHYFKPALRQAQLDVDFLERIFTENLLPPREECFVLEQMAARKPECGNKNPYYRIPYWQLVS
jgi:hypothetical protein